MRNTINDVVLSLLTGIALHIVARAFYEMSVEHIPDALLLPGTNPLARLAFARFLLFTVLVALLSVPLSWPFARYAVRKELNTALPGAACALVLFMLLEYVLFFSPFPRWFDYARGAVLFAALPLATAFWWRRARSG